MSEITHETNYFAERKKIIEELARIDNESKLYKPVSQIYAPKPPPVRAT